MANPLSRGSLIIFLTFAVILVTLVLQGLTLPSVIRGLGLAGISIPNQEEHSARKRMAEAAFQFGAGAKSGRVLRKTKRLPIWSALSTAFSHAGP